MVLLCRRLNLLRELNLYEKSVSSNPASSETAETGQSLPSLFMVWHCFLNKCHTVMYDVHIFNII